MTMGTALPAFLSILLNWKCIAAALVIAITSVVSLFYQRVSTYPRGPFPVPLFGNLLVLRKIENLHIKAIEWSKTYGDVFTLWIAHNPMVILNSHDVIRETLAKQNLLFAGRSSTKMRDIQTQGNHDIMFEDCTPYWKALRKVASLAVRRYALTRTVEKLCVDVVDAYVDTLAPGPQVIDSRKLFFSMLYKLTGASVYGESLNGEQRDIRRLEEIDHEYYGIVPNGLPSDIAPFLGLLYYKRERRVEVMYKEYREIVYRLFAKAEESYRPDSKENIVHCLLTARQEAIQEKECDAVYLTKENLVQVVMNLFGGATDTSASTLQWIFLRLVKHPEIQKRIQKEIEDNIGSRPPTYEDREKLPFTMACMLETFRCHPFTPVGMPHRTTADTKVGTTVIPKDTGVLYNVYRANRDPNLWEEPEEFRPDRFLDHATGRLRQDAGLTFTFGAGARACPGMKLAHVDIFYILVRFMQKVSCTAVGSTSSVTMKSIRSSLFSIPAQRDIIFCKRS